MCFESEVVQTRPDDVLPVSVPQLIVTVELPRPDDHVGTRWAIGSFDVEHLAVQFADDEEPPAAHVDDTIVYITRAYEQWKAV